MSDQDTKLFPLTVRVTGAMLKRVKATFKVAKKTRTSEVYSESDHVRELLDKGLNQLEPQEVTHHE